MTSTLIFFLLIFIQHHPPPPPPSGFGIYSVIVLNDPADDEGSGRNWGNGRFANAVRGTRSITSPFGDEYSGFCAVYEGIASGNIVDLNRRNWNFLTNWIKNNPSDGVDCGVTLQDACRFALSEGGETFNTRCDGLYLPLSKKLIVFLIFSFILIVFCRTSKSLN
jgi:hypothetical protein